MMILMKTVESCTLIVSTLEIALLLLLLLLLDHNRVEDLKVIAIAFERCVDDPSKYQRFVICEGGDGQNSCLSIVTHFSD